jgi:hypothetical protein
LKKSIPKSPKTLKVKDIYDSKEKLSFNNTKEKPKFKLIDPQEFYPTKNRYHGHEVSILEALN